MNARKKITINMIKNFYLYILGREPESKEVVRLHYNSLKSREFDFAREEFLKSEEFFINYIKLIGNSLLKKYEESTNLYYQMIKECYIDDSIFIDTYKNFNVEMDSYYDYHKERFKELFSYYLYFIKSRLNSKKRNLRVLEIGTSAHTLPLYKSVAKLNGVDIILESICYPRKNGVEWAKKLGSDKHIMIDLNKLNNIIVIRDFIRRNKLKKYDFIVCCEVIEHLTNSPKNIFLLIRELMKNDGGAYVSTPNFLNFRYIQNILREGLNPLPRFDEYDGNKDCHHHFREYSPLELEQYLGVISQNYIIALSDCWSKGDLFDRNNIVMIIQNS